MIVLSHTPTIIEGKYSLIIKAVSSSEIPLEVFLYRANIDGEDIYSAVCSVYDIDTYTSNYPEIDSISQDGVVFFRKDIIEKEFETASELAEFRTIINEQVRQLDEDYIRTRVEEGYGEETLVTLNEETV